jgi:chitinase
MDLPNMGGDTITATNLAYNQILATGMKNFKLGITVMIGQNNITKSVFTEKDAADLVNYSKENSNILLLSIWSMNRDNPLNGPLFESTQIKQGDFAFSNTFNTWVTNKPKIEITTVEVPHIVTPSAPAPVIPDPVPIKIDEIKKIIGFPAKVFAPFCDVNLWPTFDVTKTMDKTGTNWYTLAFITADLSGNPAWGSSVKLDDRFYGDTIDYLRSKGGDIIISFGGASGQELALMTTDVGLLQKKYQRVIDMYAPRWVDFDIEGGAILDNNSVIRRSQAVAGLVAANPGLRTSVTLPASPSGLLSEGVELLKTAAKYGWAIDGNFS